jgi:CubicO group peptidase (beta-lactamase class C family)
MFKSLCRSLALILLTGYLVSAQQAPPTQKAPASPSLAPSAVGVSAQRLQRLHDGMKGFVDRNEAAGIVTLVVRDGRMVDFHATGYQDKESKTPMRTDTIFRIMSMTKPVTSVAVMMLYEEGKLFLTDPVSKIIPAFKSAASATTS